LTGLSIKPSANTCKAVFNVTATNQRKRPLPFLPERVHPLFWSCKIQHMDSCLGSITALQFASDDALAQFVFIRLANRE